jgi:putative cell wall-binding protein
MTRRAFVGGVLGGVAASVARPVLGDPSGAASAQEAGEASVSAAGWGPPPIITRAQWGADESLGNRSREYARVEKAVVHHTAIENSDPYSEMRAIHRYHVLSNGWWDIGYNFVIARDGRIFEGRWARDYGPFEVHDGEDIWNNLVVGAHATGHNRGTLGIALMGDFTRRGITPEAFNSLANLIAWKFWDHRVTAYGATPYTLSDGSTRTFPNIIGHGDVVQSSCPGSGIHPHLANLRTAVAERLVSVRRIQDGDRYKLAARLGRRPIPPDTVFVASGQSFPDGLALCPAVIAEKAGFLLTARQALPEPTAAALQQMHPKRIVVVGGPASISDATLNAMRPYAPTVQRLAGADRYETAALIAQRQAATMGDIVIVCSGTHYADALAVGPYAASIEAPILLTDPAELPPATKQALTSLAPRAILVIGGTRAISDAVANELGSYADIVRRVSGEDRYGTAIAISKRRGVVGDPTVYLVNGTKFPHALAAGPAAFRAKASLLTVAPGGIPGSVTDEMRRTHTRTAVLIGDAAAISTESENYVRSVLLSMA